MAKKEREFNGYVFTDNGHGDLYNEELDRFLIYRPYPLLVQTITHKDDNVTLNREQFNKNVKENKGVFEEGYEENDDGTVFVKKEDISKEVKDKVNEEAKKQSKKLNQEEFDNYQSKVYGSDVRKADERMKEVFGEDFKYDEEIKPDKVYDDESDKKDTWTDIDGSPLHKGDIFRLKDTENFSLEDFKDDGIDIRKDDKVQLLSEETDGYSNVKNLRTGEIIEGLSNAHLDTRFIGDLEDELKAHLQNVEPDKKDKWEEIRKNNPYHPDLPENVGKSFWEIQNRFSKEYFINRAKEEGTYLEPGTVIKDDYGLEYTVKEMLPNGSYSVSNNAKGMETTFTREQLSEIERNGKKEEILENIKNAKTQKELLELRRQGENITGEPGTDNWDDNFAKKFDRAYQKKEREMVTENTEPDKYNKQSLIEAQNKVNKIFKRDGLLDEDEYYKAIAKEYGKIENRSIQDYDIKQQIRDFTHDLKEDGAYNKLESQLNNEDKLNNFISKYHEQEEIVRRAKDEYERLEREKMMYDDNPDMAGSPADDQLYYDLEDARDLYYEEKQKLLDLEKEYDKISK